MKRSFIGIPAATVMLDSLGQTAERVSHAVRAWNKRTRRNSAGTKLQRQAEAGILTMRAPGGLVSQLYCELQQRNFKQGATK